MIITALVDNETMSKDYINKHGLSLFIKTDEHKILFDLGPDDTFIKNAEKLNIDLKEVDIVVISHGHYDHGGGLKEFLKYNSKAKVYIRKSAFEPHYLSILKLYKHNIGLDDTIIENERIIFTNEHYNIDENLCLFSNIKMLKACPKGNNNLLKKENRKFIKDDFIHEQGLLIYEKDEYILLTGCSHCGILNILEKAEVIAAREISTVIGGFHLMDTTYDNENVIATLIKEFDRRKTKFYTCHCTGMSAYKKLKNDLKEKIDYLKTGETIDIA